METFILGLYTLATIFIAIYAGASFYLSLNIKKENDRFKAENAKLLRRIVIATVASRHLMQSEYNIKAQIKSLNEWIKIDDELSKTL